MRIVGRDCEDMPRADNRFCFRMDHNVIVAWVSIKTSMLTAKWVRVNWNQICCFGFIVARGANGRRQSSWFWFH